MKKISNILLSVSILLITLMLFVVEYNKNDNVFKDTTKSYKTNNALAIMLDDGNGNYKPSSTNAFPTSGYTFNSELSKCENGGEVTWDDTNKKVVVSSNVSDKCYIYFDKIVVKLTDYVIGLYTTQGANNLYHHDGTLANGINDGSYRYAGSYETTNNWVCFGMDDETKTYANGWCDDEHLYRIIGVFDSVIVDDAGNATTKTEQRVKLIKSYEGTEASLGTPQHNKVYRDASYYKGKLLTIPGYNWSEISSDWTMSTLNTAILNGTYLTTIGTNWADKIATTEWIIGGADGTYAYQITPSSIYQNEVENPSTRIVSNPKYNAKVGLMYASDYGLAAAPINWTTTLYPEYNSDTNKNNNWLYLGVNEWTITPSSDVSGYVVFVHYNGSIDSSGVDTKSGKIVRPTFFLNSNVTFEGGQGTETNPYRIA